MADKFPRRNGIAAHKTPTRYWWTVAKKYRIAPVKTVNILDLLGAW